MIENDYLLAWSVYAVAALGLLLVWVRITGWMWRWLRELLWLAMAVLLFTPTLVDPAREMLAPAIAVGALDLLFKVGSNLWRAVADLSMYGLIACVLYLIFAALRWPLERWWHKRRAATAPQAANAQAEEPTLRDLLREREMPRHPRVEPRL
jgi:hypothetical protein